MGKISGPLKPKEFVTVAAGAEMNGHSAVAAAATEKHFAKRYMRATCQRRRKLARLFAAKMAGRSPANAAGKRKIRRRMMLACSGFCPGFFGVVAAGGFGQLMPDFDRHAQTEDGERHHEQRPAVPVARDAQKGGRFTGFLAGHKMADKKGLDGAADIGAAVHNAGTG